MRGGVAAGGGLADQFAGGVVGFRGVTRANRLADGLPRCVHMLCGVAVGGGFSQRSTGGAGVSCDVAAPCGLASLPSGTAVAFAAARGAGAAGAARTAAAFRGRGRAANGQDEGADHACGDGLKCRFVHGGVGSQ